MTYNELVQHGGYKIPRFTMEWLILVSKKPKKEIKAMKLEDIAKFGKAGAQAMRELSSLINKSDPVAYNLVRSIRASIPVIERKFIGSGKSSDDEE